MKTIALVLVSLVLTAAACKKEAADSGRGSRRGGRKVRARRVRVEPGSHEDWCGEHARAGVAVHPLQPGPDRRLQGDRRLVRGARRAGVAVPEVQPGSEDRQTAEDAMRRLQIADRPGARPSVPAAATSPRRSPGTRRSADGAMCAEHGVLEALCTKCNPKLIPVFQAKGDWCAEHGFPESILPDLPPGARRAPGRRRVVERRRAARRHPGPLRAQGDRAGSPASRPGRPRPREGGARLEVLVTLAYDARRRAEVNARAPGVVRSLAVEIGERGRARRGACVDRERRRGRRSLAPVGGARPRQARRVDPGARTQARGRRHHAGQGRARRRGGARRRRAPTRRRRGPRSAWSAAARR